MVCQCRNALSRQSSKNCGSCFFFDMAATTPSSSPGGRLSDSISVMKPWRYFCARRASTSWDLIDTWIFKLLTLFILHEAVFGFFPSGFDANFLRQVGDAQGGGVQTVQLAQRHFFEGAAYGC